MKNKQGFIKTIIIIVMALIAAKFIFHLEPADLWNSETFQTIFAWLKKTSALAWQYIVYGVDYLVAEIPILIKNIR